MRSLKQNRTASFITVALVYAISAAVGILAYISLDFVWWLSLLIADVLATCCTFAFSIMLGNASVYDPYWSVQPIVILCAFAFGYGFTPLGALLLFVVCLWGVRLTANWAYAFYGLMHQDWRYTMLKERTGMLYPLVNFVGIHMVPTVIVYGCTLPAVYSFVYVGRVNVLSVIFLCVSVLATAIQGISDIQLHRFRRRGQTGFIRCGLWKYSRHPNYLGEILMWFGVAFSVISVFPHAWYLAAGAVSNLILFLAVSIPMADARQARKSGFSEYKAQTRMLLPIHKNG